MTLFFNFSPSVSSDSEFLVTCQREVVIKYFTLCTFYCRVILAVHCLPIGDLLVLSRGEWDVPVRNSLEFTQECLLSAAG